MGRIGFAPGLVLSREFAVSRENVAAFLQGLFVFPLCALFGGLVALLFGWAGVRRWLCISFFSLFPLLGALKTRQRPLIFGLFAGLLLSIVFAVGVRAQSVSPTRSLFGVVICLDPGHTSETSAGTRSADGRLTERHVNWIIGQRLKTLLTVDGARVVLTKQTEGELVTNRRRAEMANAARANLFLRLHCDAGAAAGIGTFYPDRPGTRFGVTGPSARVIAESRRAALAFQPALADALAGTLANRGIKGDSATFVGGKQGALTGSIFAHVPALTVEMCVLTNAHDYAFIRTAAGRERLAQALRAGVKAVIQSERR